MNTIKLDGIKLKFKQPFSLKYYIENGYYCYECEEFDYFGRAKHKEEMIKQFQEDLYNLAGKTPNL